jgi:hypothetical protein
LNRALGHREHTVNLSRRHFVARARHHNRKHLRIGMVRFNGLSSISARRTGRKDLS